MPYMLENPVDVTPSGTNWTTVDIEQYFPDAIDPELAILYGRNTSGEPSESWNREGAVRTPGSNWHSDRLFLHGVLFDWAGVSNGNIQILAENDIEWWLQGAVDASSGHAFTNPVNMGTWTEPNSGHDDNWHTENTGQWTAGSDTAHLCFFKLHRNNRSGWDRAGARHPNAPPDATPYPNASRFGGDWASLIGFTDNGMLDIWGGSSNITFYLAGYVSDPDLVHPTGTQDTPGVNSSWRTINPTGSGDHAWVRISPPDAYSSGDDWRTAGVRTPGGPSLLENPDFALEGGVNLSNGNYEAWSADWSSSWTNRDDAAQVLITKGLTSEPEFIQPEATFRARVGGDLWNIPLYDPEEAPGDRTVSVRVDGQTYALAVKPRNEAQYPFLSFRIGGDIYGADDLGNHGGKA